jgi:hypothetical protein
MKILTSVITDMLKTFWVLLTFADRFNVLEVTETALGFRGNRNYFERPINL